MTTSSRHGSIARLLDQFILLDDSLERAQLGQFCLRAKSEYYTCIPRFAAHQEPPSTEYIDMVQLRM